MLSQARRAPIELRAAAELELRRRERARAVASEKEEHERQTRLRELERAHPYGLFAKPRPFPGTQTALIASEADEVFYGGARGGGKSFGVLLDWLAHEERWGSSANGIVFRRTMPELEELIELAQRVFATVGARWRASRRTFVFASGARLKFRYLEKDEHASRYQGHEYTWAAFEEAGSFPTPRPINMIRATLRSPYGVKVRMILTGNPGGVGHSWLKSRYIDAGRPGTIISERLETTKGRVFEWTRTFIPSKISDNPLLPDDYEAQLELVGEPWLVRAWKSGDWNIVAGGRFDSYFTPEKAARIRVPDFILPASWPLWRAFDWGSSAPFSVGWWTKANGEDVQAKDGTGPLWFPAGSAIRVAEWYGRHPDLAKHTNVGLELDAVEIARGIKEREQRLFPGRAVLAGPADTSIWATTGVRKGQTIASELSSEGIVFTPASKGPGSRVAGWLVMQRLLRASSEGLDEPGLYATEGCVDWFRTVPMLPRDKVDRDDVDSSAEDHAADETRYFLTAPSYGAKMDTWRI